MNLHRKTLFVRQDSAVVNMDSQQLWLHAQNPHLTKPTQIPARSEKGFTKPHAIWRATGNWWLLGGGKSGFFGHVACGELPMLQWTVLCPRTYRQHYVDSADLKKDRHKKLGRNRVGRRGEKLEKRGKIWMHAILKNIYIHIHIYLLFHIYVKFQTLETC